MARAESNDAVPSTGIRSNEAVSSECRPPLRLGGLPGQHRDPSGQDREWGILLDSRVVRVWRATVARLTSGRPGRSARPARSASWTHRSRSVVFNRCSRANAGDPLDSYQSAARRCSLAMTSGSTRRSSAEQELPEQRVVAIPPTPAVQRDQEQARRLQAAKLRIRDLTLRESRRTAEQTADREPPCAAGTAEHPPAAASTTRGTGSRPRTDHHRRSSTPRRCCLWRSPRRGRGRPATLRSARSPRQPAHAVRSTWAWEKICSAPAASRARSPATNSSASPEARNRGR